VSRLNPRLQPALDDVLRRGLARRPKDRYATVEELRLALGRALQQRPPRRRILAVAAVVGLAILGCVALAVPWRQERPQPTADGVAETAPLRCWLLYEGAEERSQLTGADMGGPGVAVTEMPVRGPRPEFLPELPVWPKPAPLLVLSAPRALAFVHPFSDSRLPARIVKEWPRLRDWSVPSKSNLILNGNFEEAQLSPWNVWDYASGPKQQRRITIGISPGERDNRAAAFENNDPDQAQHGLVLFQHLPPLPAGGSVLVLRCRARTESGNGRLALMPRIPFHVPKDDRGEGASKLRARAEAMQRENADPQPDRWLYALRDWVTPPDQWQTYYVIWEQPPFGLRERHRNLDIWYVGVGKVWIDDVELFAWRSGEP